MCAYLSSAPYGDPAHNPGTCPDWELNQRLFGPKASAQSTDLHQPGWDSLKQRFLALQCVGVLVAFWHHLVVTQCITIEVRKKGLCAHFAE